MAIASSGAIDLDEFHVEAGGTSGDTCSMDDADIRGLIGVNAGSTNAMDDWYGASAEFYSHKVDHSVRFEDQSNGNLEQTLGTAGDLRKNTTSYWFRRTKVGIDEYIFASGASLNSNYDNSTVILVDSADKWQIYQETNGSQALYVVMTQKLRDIGSWYHVVVAPND